MYKYVYIYMYVYIYIYMYVYIYIYMYVYIYIHVFVQCCLYIFPFPKVHCHSTGWVVFFRPAGSPVKFPRKRSACLSADLQYLLQNHAENRVCCKYSLTVWGYAGIIRHDLWNTKKSAKNISNFDVVDCNRPLRKNHLALFKL